LPSFQIASPRKDWERGFDLRDPWSNEFHERISRALLDILILARLEEKSMNGYEITTFLIKKFGITISTSVIYSTLYSMERNGLVKGEEKRRGRVYELTEKGNKTLEDARSDLKQIQVYINKVLGKTKC
jgi:DNA-binding PadR family transcriptional regulator